MKISGWHKTRGDDVSWWAADSQYDRVYMGRVFGDEYTRDLPSPENAGEVIRGGSGYAISVKDGHEVYCKENDPDLPYEIDHFMPDYSLYGIEDTAYGFLTKGCPRGCSFCHTKAMQGGEVYTFASLDEFWNGQKNIRLLDPNITASKDWGFHFESLARSRAYVDFTQGLDIRLMTREKCEGLNDIRWKMIHFAWDNPNDDLRSKLEFCQKHMKRWRRQIISCYVLTNYNSTHEQDLYRINTLREFHVQPYVMIYRKHTAPPETRKLQRWCNPFIFWKVPSFDEYRVM